MAWYEKAADNLDGADQDPFSRTNWELIYADDPAQLSSNRFRGPDVFAECAYKYTGVSLGGNQYCQGTTYMPFVEDQQALFFVRIADSDNFYRLNDYPRYGTGRFYMYKKVAGSFTLLGGGYQDGGGGSNPATIKLQAENTTLSATEVGVVTRTWTDSTLNSGSVGIGAYTPPSLNYMTIDNYSAGDDVANHPAMAMWGGVPRYGCNSRSIISPIGRYPYRRGSEV